MPKRRPKPRVLKVLNRGLAASVARWIINNKPGTWRQASPELRALQPTLSRLVRETLPILRRSTFDELAAVLIEDGHIPRSRTERTEQLVRLEDSALSETGITLLVDHGRWINDQIVGVFERPSPYWLIEEDKVRVAEADDFPTITYGSGAQLTGVAGQRAEDYTDLRQHIETRNSIQERLDRFRADAHKRGHNLQRVELAELRMLAPLLEGPDTGYVERSWEEMGEKELEDFVRHGIAREEILLKRSQTIERIQELLARETHPVLTGRARRKG